VVTHWEKRQLTMFRIALDLRKDQNMVFGRFVLKCEMGVPIS